MKKSLTCVVFATLLTFLLAACSDKEDTVQPLKLQLNPSELTLTVGEKATVTITGVPQDADVLWMTDAENIASQSIECMIRQMSKLLV